LNQIGRQRRQAIILSIRPAEFEREILALNVTGLGEPLAECDLMVRKRFSGTPMEKSDQGHWPLRSCRNRPRNSYPANNLDEFPPPHAFP
jgi:hypothetical protein